MPHYRMYLLDQDRKFRDVRQIIAEDDMEALSQARELSREQGWELWQESRMIGQSQSKAGPL